MNDRNIGLNKRARFDYEVIETFEAGIVLLGSEVKSLRNGRVNMSDAYAAFDRHNTLTLYNVHIPEYKLANQLNHKPLRNRVLLLHKKQNLKLIGLLKKGGVTLVPLSMYFSQRGWVKVSLALAKGKKDYDKRKTIQEREWNREKQRIMKGQL